MLKNFIFTGLGGLVVILVVVLLETWKKLKINIKKAEIMGLRYVVAPWMGVGTWQLFVSEFTTPWLLSFPISRDWSWVKMQARNLSWNGLRAPELKYGDTWVVVTPYTCSLKTSNAELINQIISRTDDFPKPVASYEILNIFGKNILSSKGNDWKRHKRIVGVGFGEKTNRIVFEESLRQARGMIEGWVRDGEDREKKGFLIGNAGEGAATLSLHVICAAGFGVPQLWNHEGEDKLEGKGIPGFSGHGLGRGHRLSMKKGLVQLLEHIIWVFVFPSWILKISPFNVHKAAYAAFIECKIYFDELVDIKGKMIHEKCGKKDQERDKSTNDLLDAMMNASSYSCLERKNEGIEKRRDILSKPEIIGNSFIFLLAGHETTANSIHFSMIYLACDPQTQRGMQQDIDKVLDGRSDGELDYYQDMPRLYNSLVGATFNEQVRLIPATSDIPRDVITDQTVHLNNRSVVIPSGTYIHLNVVGVNRNPRYWGGDRVTDLDDFVPMRWLKTDSEEDWRESKNMTVSFDELKEKRQQGETRTLRKPVKGSFMSFSDGPRVCPGKRFAQIETTAVLTGIFSKWSVELDVGEWATDEDIENMGVEEKNAIYTKAIASAKEKIRRSDQVITLQMRGGDKVPLRIVERGKERF